MKTPRLSILRALVLLLSFVILSRLFYWQVISNRFLTNAARDQRTISTLLEPARGQILASDDFALVANEPRFVVFAYLPQLVQDKQKISQDLAQILADRNPKSSTEAAKPLETRINQLQTSLYQDITNKDRSWVPLSRGITKKTKEKIENLNIVGIGFDQSTIRSYPEASMSAHLLGFVGKNNEGENQGYFGLEGFYNLELKGRKGVLEQDTDATGEPILIGLFNKKQARDGRTLKTHINRSIQHLVETQLKQAIETYGAKSGEILVMEPHTGGILAMASWPSYDPSSFIEFDPTLYKNPIVANTYEPGSTFKVLTMAAAIEEEAITPQTTCDDTCDGPVKIGKFHIRTWNNEYNPGQTMQQVLNRSDNTGMVFVAFQLGKEKFVQYLNSFGMGQLTGIDLQDETGSFLRQTWGDIDLATTSFGQGIAVTGIQMATAVSVIANGGNLIEPHVVAQVQNGISSSINPKIKHRVISEKTAKTVTEMMINSAHHGEAQWAVLKDYQVAGKTGTSQVAIDGHYDEDKTIASFIGFAPAKDPKFTMLVKLTEPQTSPWASETAAPTWFKLAYKLLVHLNIPPDSSN